MLKETSFLREIKRLGKGKGRGAIRAKRQARRDLRAFKQTLNQGENTMLAEKIHSVRMALRTLPGQVSEEVFAVLKLADAELGDAKQLAEELESTAFIQAETPEAA